MIRFAIEAKTINGCKRQIERKTKDSEGVFYAFRYLDRAQDRRITGTYCNTWVKGRYNKLGLLTKRIAQYISQINTDAQLLLALIWKCMVVELLLLA